MAVFHRYILIQVPGWGLAALILYALHRWLDLPVWAVAALLAADVIKDFALYPFLRRAYETDTKTGIQLLIGEPATVERGLDPSGYVRVRGELWRAEPANVGDTLPKGARVRVTAVRDTILLVEPESPVDRGGGRH